MDINQREFPSTAQKSIWHCSVFMSPFADVVPEGFDKSIKELLVGQSRLYSFMKNLYKEMYDNPAEYSIPTGEHDRFMKGRKVDDLTSSEKTKEGRIRNRFQRTIQFYQKMLYEIGANGEHIQGKLWVPKSMFKDMINRNNLRIMRGKHEKIIKGFARQGLDITIRKTDALIDSDEHPHMLRALRALCRLGSPSYRMTNFLRCSFEGLLGRKPGFDDVINILDMEAKANAREMHQYMTQLRCKVKVQPLKNTTLGSVWKLAYLKGKSVYGFHADVDWNESYVYFNAPENISEVGSRLNQTKPSLFEWYEGKFPVQGCACQYNRRVDLGGGDRRICGFSNRMVVTSPSLTDYKNMRQVIKIFREKKR